MNRTITTHSETSHSVLVIGGGLAGMYAAISAAEAGAHVVILSKGKTGNSGNSLVAMTGHRFAPDAPTLRREYRERFLASGAGVQDPAVAEFFVTQAAAAMEQLKSYGFPLEYRCLTEAEDGKQYPYFACCTPKQGRILTNAVRTYIEEHTQVEIKDGVTVCDIVTEDGTAYGVLAEQGGELHYYPGKAVVLATGGAGMLYSATSNTSDITGDGYAMALRCGLSLTGMEFVQFYPYRIYSPARADIFPDIFEYGAVFRNEKGERFMDNPAYPKKELENRDVVARAMYRQQEVRLDLSHCDMAYLEQECPNIAKIYREHPNEPLLLRPVTHFFMGGVPLRPDCSTDLQGLFVCGEVTGGLHGANRLAGSALSEVVLFGRIAGKNAAAVPSPKPIPLPARYADMYPTPSDSDPLTSRAVLTPDSRLSASATTPTADDIVLSLYRRLRQVMWSEVSLVRTSKGLDAADRQLREIWQEFSSLRPRNLKRWIELRSLLMTAEQVIRAAASRKESLGAHYRED